MTTYVDTSTLIKLMATEAGSAVATTIWTSAPSLAAVSLIEVEAVAALAAAHRQARLTDDELADAHPLLDQLLGQVGIVEVDANLIGSARELATRHALRGYDAVHLAAATLVGADVFTSADSVLCAAAANEGMLVANPLDR
ncbi:MAG: type II toxin-antitoxin system VapC family toxin [Candidatus Microthrix parvicella]